MTEKDVEKIKTPSVRHAFERAKLNRLTKAQFDAYESEDVKYSRFTEVIQEAEDKGLAEGSAKTLAKFVLEMLKSGETDASILKYTGITPDELTELKHSLSTTTIISVANKSSSLELEV